MRYGSLHVPNFGMTHLALRNTKRGRLSSLKDEKSCSELLELVKALFLILFTIYNWLRHSFYNIYLATYPAIGESKNCSLKQEEASSEDDEPGYLVAVRGVGLTSAYTGRRALFAIYPPSREGLEISASGPGQLSFEYRATREGLLLASYVPPRPGSYRLRVSRHGARAVGSPFHLRVEDPPPGYQGSFGTSLWEQRPSPPPLLTGIVDFVTEKMYLTSDGRLVKLRDHQPLRPDKKNSLHGTPSKTVEQVQLLKKEPEGLNSSSRTSECSLSTDNDRRVQSARKQVLNRIEKLLESVSNQGKKEPHERYKHVSRALIKELSLSLRILNLIGSSQEAISPPEDSPDCETKRGFVIPEIRITGEEMEDRYLEGDRFLGYSERRSGKLGWEREATEREIGERKGWRRPRSWKDCGMGRLLGLGRAGQGPGIRLLHDVYRERAATACTLNNSASTPVLAQGAGLSEAEINRNNSIVNNVRGNIVVNSKKETKSSNVKMERRKNKLKMNGLSESLRTLSLPDFNRVYSLSVRGLRKVKSCGDKSFRAVSNSNLTISFMSIFEKDNSYDIVKAKKANNKEPRNAASLVKVTHYGSQYESRRFEYGNRSVGEWRKYWEELQQKQDEKEFGRECSLELTGIVDRGKAMFESGKDFVEYKNVNVHSSVKTQRSKSVDTVCSMSSSSTGYLSVDDSNEILTIPSPTSNKTAFQKAREMFEGEYCYRDCWSEKDNRRKSLSERFEEATLEMVSQDYRTGYTRKGSAIPCLGSLYHSQYPHIPITPAKRRGSHYALYTPWEYIYHKDPNYV